MNYLAHAYLSFNEPGILVGNMISDFVKGSRQFGYSVIIQKGIALHRAIDAYTDGHPATARAKDFFRSHYRLYSGPIMDIVYDHFVANDKNIFTDASLLAFSNEVYDKLENEAMHLPPVFLNVLTYMKSDNWLYQYRTTQGIERSLHGLVRRASFIHDSNPAIDIFHGNYEALQECYEDFFPGVKQMAKERLDAILA